MAYMTTIGYHDVLLSGESEAMRIDYVTDTPTCEPYYRLKFGDAMTIFTSLERLLELRGLIEAQAQAREDEAREQREEIARDEAEMLETGADRCPVRE